MNFADDFFEKMRQRSDQAVDELVRWKPTLFQIMTKGEQPGIIGRGN
jgi:hypothetical protein